MNVHRDRGSITAAFAVLFLLVPAILPAAPVSEWSSEVTRVDGLLRQGKWKQGLKQARKVTDQLLSKSWYGAGLRESLTDLAVLLAVAEANLDRKDDAVWHWYIAQNLDRRVRKRDLSPYGKAAKLLLEYPLRRLHEIPPGFEIRDQTLYSKVERPEPKEPPRADILNNTAAVREKPGDFQVELVVDKEGHIHHPVVMSDYLHPIVIYAVLEWLRKLPALEPARIDGEPSDYIDVVSVHFDFSRW